MITISSVLVLFLQFSNAVALVAPSKTSLRRSIPSHPLLTVRPRLGGTCSNTHLSALPSIFAQGVGIETASNTATSVTDSITSSPLFVYFVEKLIAYAVPSFFVLFTVFVAARLFRRKKDEDEFSLMDGETAVSELYNDLYGSTKDGSGNRGGFDFFGGGGDGKLSKAQRRNLGIPEKEYLKITNLNERYDSYDFSLAKATKSKAYAAARYRSRAFDRALTLALAGDEDDINGNVDSLPAYAKTQLLEAEKIFLSRGKELIKEIQLAEAKLAQEAIDSELKSLGMEEFEMDPEPQDDDDDDKADKKDGVKASVKAEEANFTVVAKNNTEQWKSPLGGRGKKKDLLQTISKLQRELKQFELEFLKYIIRIVGVKRGAGIRAAILGDIAVRGSGSLLNQLEQRPLSAILFQGGEDSKTASTKTLYVMDFPGDIQASQLNNLREEVTAVIRNAKAGDEALVILQTGGGTVTGYGLAAGQLVRLKQAGLYLTMAVEQVAASGGYLMACVADRIVASPFAVLGSIGVISEVPNFYERLKQEGIEFQTVTAGKFKRTLTPTKKVTKDDLQKSKEELEEVLVQFSDFVKENRPNLDIDAVATGETWFGNAAVEKGLCDEIKTVDDLLLNYVTLGYRVLQISYSPPIQPEGLLQLLPVGGQVSQEIRGSSSLLGMAARWLVQTLAGELRTALQEELSIERRYVAKDNTSDRFQMRD